MKEDDARIRLNDLAIQMSPASMNFGCTALSFIIGISKEIRCCRDFRMIVPSPGPALMLLMRSWLGVQICKHCY